MANPKRLEILNILKKKSCCVEDLCALVGVRKANMSQHLALLRRARLVEVRKEGLYAYYRITDPRIVHPCRILKNIWEDKDK